MSRLLPLLLLTACAGRYEAMKPMEFSELTAPGPMKVVELNGFGVHYLDAGEGQPVVLLHGLGEHAGYWKGNVAALTKAGARLIVPDLLGHGRSAKPHDGEAPQNLYGPGAQAALVRALLDDAGVAEPVVLVGHSMGGQIAIRYALAWPERVKRLVLLAPAGVERFTRGEADWMKRVSTTDLFKSRDEAALRAHFRRNVFGRWGEAAEHHLQERVQLRAATDFDAYMYAVVRAIHGMLDEPVVDELGALKVPVTVVFGSADALVPNPLLHGGGAARVVADAKALLPKGARVDLLDGVGHMPQIEAPDEVTARIVEAMR